MVKEMQLHCSGWSRKYGERPRKGNDLVGQGKVKDWSTQGQGSAKVKDRQGQGKVKARKMTSSRKGQGQVKARSRTWQGKERDLVAEALDDGPGPLLCGDRPTETNVPCIPSI